MFGVNKLLSNSNKSVKNVNRLSEIVNRATNRVEEIGETLGVTEGKFRLSTGLKLIDLQKYGHADGDNNQEFNSTWFELVGSDNNSGGATVNAPKKSDNQLTKNQKFDVDEKDSTFTKGVFVLPFPQAISTTTTHAWSSEDLGALGNINVQNLDQNTFDTFKTVASSLGIRGVEALSGNTITKLAKLKYKSLANPHKKALYSGTELRNIDFSFLFSPRSKNDVNDILSTIEQFTKSSHPTISSAAGGTGNRLLFPDYFNFKITSGEYVLVDFKDAVITNISVEYFSESGVWSTFSDGMPTSIKLNISFIETDQRDSTSADSIVRGI